MFVPGGVEVVLADCVSSRAAPNAAIDFRAACIQIMGTGPNLEMDGHGSREADRGIRCFYEWSREHLGHWVYPRHVK